MQIEEINEKNSIQEESIDTSSIETIKKISKLISKQDIKKIMEQIPQEAINQISDEEIKKIKEVKEVTPETLEKLSAGLQPGTKKVLKYLGASAVLATVGVGSYYLGNLNAKKDMESSLKNSYEDGYKKGYKQGNKIGSINGYRTASQRASFEQLSEKENRDAISMGFSFLTGVAVASQMMNSQNESPSFFTEKDLQAKNYGL